MKKFVASCSLVLVAACAVEATEGDGPSEALTVFAGNGQAVSINGSSAIDIRSAGIRWSRRWQPVGNGLLHGKPTVSVEIMPVVEFETEPTTRGPALNIIYEHRSTPKAALHPVLRAGAGVLLADREVPSGATRLNFSLLVGFGLDIDLSERWQLAPEYRFHHVSNANTGPINPGINAHTLIFGITLRLAGTRTSHS
jgi:opacity protein-like surface antigen